MTVKMRKGNKWADIYDSPETIAQAKKDGYHVAKNDEIVAGGFTLSEGNIPLPTLPSLPKTEPSATDVLPVTPAQSEPVAEPTAGTPVVEATPEAEKKSRGRPPKQESV